jgi:DHA1 family bicyclomycin/chloramphenicol resistance-like MFS transporter
MRGVGKLIGDPIVAKNNLSATNGKLYLLITLSAMTALSPFVTDVYLPSLPALTVVFNTSASMVQLTLSTSMLGIAIGQLLFGPISDKTGRRKPLFVSLLIFLLSTIGCILSQNIYILIIFRLLQGFGAAGGIVIARSVASDLFTGNDLLKFLAIMAAVQGIAPMAAPVAGGALLLFTDWKGIFLCIGLLGIAVFFISLYMKESHQFNKMEKISIFSTFKFFVPVLKNKLLVLYIALVSFSMALIFAYIASSPFIIQEHYGLSPMAYSVFFAVNAACPSCGSIISVRFGNPQKSLKIFVMGLLIFSFLTSLSLLFNTNIVLFCLSIFPTLICAGAILPISTNIVLDLEHQYKGTASALLGSSTFLIGGIAMPLAGLGNILNATAYVMTVSAIATMILFKIIKCEMNLT